VLRRTVDLLAQLPYVEAVSEELRRKARRALRAINRFPVCELEDLLPPSPPQPAEALAPAGELRESESECVSESVAEGGAPSS
jgi:hypothetical protein